MSVGGYGHGEKEREGGGGERRGRGKGLLKTGVSAYTTSLGRAFQSTMVFGYQGHLPVLSAVAAYFVNLGMDFPCSCAKVLAGCQI